MKTVYIILFSIDTVILVIISYLFLRLRDNNASGTKLAELLAAALACIILLVYLLYKYMKIPSDKNHA